MDGDGRVFNHAMLNPMFGPHAQKLNPLRNPLQVSLHSVRIPDFSFAAGNGPAPSDPPFTVAFLILKPACQVAAGSTGQGRRDATKH